MKPKILICSTLAIGLVAGCLSERHEHQAEQAKLQAEARVSRADAEKVALSQVPTGTIKEAELEKEKGKLIWSFDIAVPGAKDITEVNIDALTGAVISVEKETPEQQRKEKDEDKKKDKD